jgi:sugar lactone lactonase YvrE
MITQFSAELAINSRDLVGEGPVWNEAEKRALWTDNAVGIIHEAEFRGESGWRETRRWNLERPVGAAIPRTRGGLVVVGGTEVLLLDDAGKITPLATIDADPNAVSLNDAKCDRKGRLWVGTAAQDFSSRIGALYRVDPDGTVATVLTDVVISNGLDWSPDGSVFYHIDSFTRSVCAFDLDLTPGTIRNRRHIITLPAGVGSPDGMTVDRDGCLWVAIFGSGEVRRYSPDGEILACVKVSAPCVTSCAFGGSDGGDLLITSAAVRLPEPVLSVIGLTADMANLAARAPGAGGLFVCRPGCSGNRVALFAG